MTEHTIYTDGACYPNPGPGSWAIAYFTKQEHTRLLEQGHHVKMVPNTTNNRMELTAGIEAMKFVIARGYQDEDFTVISDSQYLVKGVNEYMRGWQMAGWKKNGMPVLNGDLWKIIAKYKAALPNLRFVHTKGHAGNPGNELVDSLCSHARKQGANYEVRRLPS